jgi:hypothetical protein
MHNPIINNVLFGTVLFYDVRISERAVVDPGTTAPLGTGSHYRCVPLQSPAAFLLRTLTPVTTVRTHRE